MASDTIIDVAEQKRLNEAREAGIPWKKWGPYLSERQWGTVREDYSSDGNAWDYFSHDQSRSRAYHWGEDGIGRHLRRQAAAVLRRRAVERARPDPEGAPVRADQQRGQPWRGREGVLLLPRQHAHALVHEVPVQVSAAGVSLSRPGGDEPAAVARGVRVRTAGHRRFRRGPVLRRLRRVRQGRARKTSSSASPCTTAGRRRRALRVLPTLWFRNTWSWGDDEPKAVVPAGGARRDPGLAPGAGRVLALLRWRPELLFTENETNTQRLWGQPNATPVRQGCLPLVCRSTATATRSTRRGRAPKAAAHYVLEVPARRRLGPSACG